MTEDHQAQDIKRNQERKVVKTTVPAYQKEEWAEHADELDMTQSEYVRCMVQAGRRDLLEFDEAVAEAIEARETAESDTEEHGTGTVNQESDGRSIELTINLDGGGSVGVE